MGQQRVGGQQLGDDLQLRGVADLEQRCAERDRGLARVVQPQHAPGHRRTQREGRAVFRASAHATARAANRDERGARLLELVAGDVLALDGGVELLLRGLRGEAVGVDLGRRDETLLRELFGAAKLVAGLLEGDLRRLDARGSALQAGLRRADVRLLFPQRALVEHRAEHRHQRGHHRAGRDRVPLAQCDALQAAGQWRRDDEPLAQPRPCVFGDRGLEAADAGLGQFDLQRARCEGPGEQRGERHAARGGDQ